MWLTDVFGALVTTALFLAAIWRLFASTLCAMCYRRLVQAMVQGSGYRVCYKGVVGTDYATTEKGGERCKCERATCHFFFDLVVVGVVEVEFSGSGVRVVVILRAVVFGVVRAEEVSGADCLVVIVLAVLVGEMVVVDDFH